tara:strand:- start:1260 stop:1706 length:447 start_codon:yes stop_codon:yes gene_type:complete
MNDIQMAVGLTQMKKFPRIVELKQKNFNLYSNLLKDINEVEILKPRKEISPYIPFRVILRTRSGTSEPLMNFMKQNGVETRTFFYPLHKQPCFKKWREDIRYRDHNFLATNHAFLTGVCLPSFAALTVKEVKYVCDVIKRFYKEGENA